MNKMAYQMLDKTRDVVDNKKEGNFPFFFAVVEVNGKYQKIGLLFVPLGSVVHFAEHLAVGNISCTAFAPGRDMISIHIFQLINQSFFIIFA